MDKYKKSLRTVCIAVLILILAFPAGVLGEGTKQGTPAPAAGAEVDLAVEAKAAVLMDAGSGKFLYEQNSHEELEPASVTKIMTMLLALEAEDCGKISLKDEVTISSRAAGMGGSQMFMEAGETRTVEELLMGMAMASANDACVAIAEYVGGTEEIFVEMMNKRAAELGMENTHFSNTNGLPIDNHYTSAHDIALMSAELLKHEEIAEYMTTWMKDVTIGKSGKESTFTLTNTNRLIKLYPDAIGIKTGFTQDAGFCLSGAAKRGELTLVAVVLGCDSSDTRWEETMRLLDYGFATYDSVKIAEKAQIMGTVPVAKGEPAQVDVHTAEELRVLIQKGKQAGLTWEACLPERLNAPVRIGDQVGELILYQDGTEIERHPLLAAASAEKAGFLKLTGKLLRGLFTPSAR